MPDRSSPDRPAAPAVPPNVVLREGWEWNPDPADDGTWMAESIELPERLRWSSDGVVTVEEGDDTALTYDDVILAVLEANASPALEERDRRVRGVVIGECVKAVDDARVHAMRNCGAFLGPYDAAFRDSMKLATKVVGQVGTHTICTNTEDDLKSARADLAAMNAQAVEVCETFAKFGWVCGGANIADVVRIVCELVKTQAIERDKLRADLSAALAERDALVATPLDERRIMLAEVNRVAAERDEAQEFWGGLHSALAAIANLALANDSPLASAVLDTSRLALAKYGAIRAHLAKAERDRLFPAPADPVSPTPAMVDDGVVQWDDRHGWVKSERRDDLCHGADPEGGPTE